MPRVRTDAAERTMQNKRLQAEVATELGQDSITIEKAVAHRRKTKGVKDIVARPIPMDDDEVVPIGVVLGSVTDFRTVAGGRTAHLAITTNAVEFGHLLLDASVISHSELLVIAMYKIDRKLGLPDDEEVGGDSLGEDED